MHLFELKQVYVNKRIQCYYHLGKWDSCYPSFEVPRYESHGITHILQWNHTKSGVESVQRSLLNLETELQIVEDSQL